MKIVFCVEGLLSHGVGY